MVSVALLLVDSVMLFITVDERVVSRLFSLLTINEFFLIGHNNDIKMKSLS